jgi:hypothetical protein
MARPYIGKSVVELERLAEANPDDANVIAGVIAELRHRNVPRAKKLLARLSGESSPSRAVPRKSTARPTKATARPTKATAKPTKAAAKDGRAKPVVPGPVVEAELATTNPDVDRSLQQAFELLRESFTLEAEILARWGMTPTLPKVIVQSVFTAWRKVLKSGPDDRGRSLELLEQDMAELAGHDGSEF